MTELENRAAVPALSRRVKALVLLATVPFVALAAGVLVLSDAGNRHLASRILIGYGVVMLMLIAGTQWRLFVAADRGRARRRLAAVLMVMLAGVISLWLPFEQSAAVQVAALGGFWLYENRLLGPTVLGSDYLSLRRWQTLVLVAALGLALMAPSLVPTVS